MYSLFTHQQIFNTIEHNWCQRVIFCMYSHFLSSNWSVSLFSLSVIIKLMVNFVALQMKWPCTYLKNVVKFLHIGLFKIVFYFWLCNYSLIFLFCCNLFAVAVLYYQIVYLKDMFYLSLYRLITTWLASTLAVAWLN